MKKVAVRTRTRVTTPTVPDNPRSTGGVCNPLHDNLRLHTVYLAPGALTPPARILRKHNDRQLKMIEASIREHGFVSPILVNPNRQIVCGHGRWLAATAMNLALVPVIELAHLSPEQLRLYAIADNKIAEQSEFDLDELRLEFIELEALDLDLKLEFTGFATSEIDDLLSGKPDEADSGDGDSTVEAVAITRPGDTWELGAHRLYCGNSLERGSYDALLGAEKARMVFADPPYNVPAKAISGKGRHKHRDFAMAAGEMSEAEFTEFLATSFRRCVEHSVDGSIAFTCIDWKHMGEMLAAGRKEYTELKNLIVWAKQSAGMGSFYRSQFELIFAWKHGNAPHVNNFGLGETGRHRSNLWQYKGNAGFHRARNQELASHPTVKPWSLVADAIRDCSKRGAIILDPFGGAGTTLIAAERTGRKARLIELDPRYCDATIRRWQELTGREAVLVASGHTFAQVSHERDMAGEDAARLNHEDADGDGVGFDADFDLADAGGEDA